MVLGHCHLFPGGLGESRQDEFGIPGTAAHLHLFIKACGFEQAQVLAPHENPAHASVKARIAPGQDGLDWLLMQEHVGMKFSSVFLPAATIRPNHSEALRKLRKARALGVRMLKFHPLIMRCDPLEPVCEPFFKEAEAARMSMVYHTGGGGWGWQSDAGRPQVCAALAKRYPALLILMAHCGTFGGMDAFEEAVLACQAHDNLYLDTTTALLPTGRARWKEALDRLGPARIIYGNDYPWASVSSVQEELAFLDSLGLDAGEKAQILGGNLMKLWQQARP